MAERGISIFLKRAFFYTFYDTGTVKKFISMNQKFTPEQLNSMEHETKNAVICFGFRRLGHRCHAWIPGLPYWGERTGRADHRGILDAWKMPAGGGAHYSFYGDANRICGIPNFEADSGNIPCGRSIANQPVTKVSKPIVEHQKNNQFWQTAVATNNSQGTDLWSVYVREIVKMNCKGEERLS